MITIVHLSDDWIGIYNGDTLQVENHTLNEQEALTAANVKFKVFEVDQPSDEDAYDFLWELPQSLKELKGRLK